jgi:hypothetical protein
VAAVAPADPKVLIKVRRLILGVVGWYCAVVFPLVSFLTAKAPKSYH